MKLTKKIKKGKIKSVNIIDAKEESSLAVVEFLASGDISIKTLKELVNNSIGVYLSLYKKEDVIGFIKSREHWFKEEPKKDIFSIIVQLDKELSDSLLQNKNNVRMRTISNLYYFLKND
jgi:hypothetical protein